MDQSILRLWTGPLPTQELFPKRKINPILHWFIHPIKRRIAKYYLQFLQKNFGLRVIAITGSSGKTTTKDMLYSILSKISPAVVTSDNGNPVYSMPTAILHCLPSTRFLILEMGVEYPGDMLFCTWMVKPNIGILTGISLAHAEYFGTIERIAAEKIRLITTTNTSITNADDPNIKIGFPTYTFGHEPSCFTQIIDAKITPELTTSLELKINNNQFTSEMPCLGIHFAIPAAAAATAAYLVDVHPQVIALGLKTFTPSPHQLAPITTKSGTLILDDTYNANPTAVQASLNVLLEVCRLTNRTPIFVFGQMNELGKYEQTSHEQIGLEIKKLEIRNLFCIGPATKFTIQSAGFGEYFENQDDLYTHLSKIITPTDCVLIKSSRSWGLDKLVEKLLLQHPSN